MAGQLICTLQIYFLLSDKEEVYKQQCCEWSINACADRQEAAEVFCDLAPYAEKGYIHSQHKNKSLI